MALVPASTEKLVTAVAALSVLGRDTTLHAPGSSPRTSRPTAWWTATCSSSAAATRCSRRLRTRSTSATNRRSAPRLEELADRVVAAGVRQVNGRLLGDESRYDSDRYPDTWPERYAEQSQVGPLSALSVNDGFSDWPDQQTREGTVESTPAADPPTYAAGQLAELLQARGVTVRGGAGAGTAPGDATEIATIESGPMTKVVDQLVTESDNQTAELLVKEMGRKDGGAPDHGGRRGRGHRRDGGARAGPAGHPGGRRVRPRRGQRGELPAAHEHPRSGRARRVDRRRSGRSRARPARSPSASSTARPASGCGPRPAPSTP